MVYCLGSVLGWFVMILKNVELWDRVGMVFYLYLF
jgi:hypothetical protein